MLLFFLRVIYGMRPMIDHLYTSLLDGRAAIWCFLFVLRALAKHPSWNVCRMMMHPQAISSQTGSREIPSFLGESLILGGIPFLGKALIGEALIRKFFLFVDLIGGCYDLGLFRLQIF